MTTSEDDTASPTKDEHGDDGQRHVFRAIRHRLTGQHTRNHSKSLSAMSGGGHDDQAQQNGNDDLETKSDDDQQGGNDSPKQDTRSSEGTGEKSASKNGGRGGGSQAEQAAQEFLGRSEERRTVRDPITHQLMEHIRDVTKEEYDAGLDEAGTFGTPNSAKDRGQHTQKHPVGGHEAVPSNFGRSAEDQRSGSSALPAFPPDASRHISFENSLDKAHIAGSQAMWVAIGLWLALTVCFVRDVKTLPVLIVLAVAFGYCTPYVIHRRYQREFDDLDALHEEQRGEQIAQSHWPESAEFINKLLGEIWPAIQPEVFGGLKDKLEDVLQANLSQTKVITEIKVADFTQGSNPLRILSVTLLPDTDWGSEKTQSKKKDEHERQPGQDELKDEMDQAKQQAGQDSRPEEAMMEEEHDPNSRYVNLSVSFAYRGKQSGSERRKRDMAQDVQAVLYLVLRLGPVALRLPVKCKLRGFVGTARIRCHLTASPPFLGQTTISFSSLPRINLDVVPLKLVSLNDIKPLALFIQRSIDSGLAAITAPKSITIDLADLISSDGITREIQSMGIVVVTLVRAHGVERADINGLSDPYALFLWSRSGKPMHSTKVLVKELSPRFQESVALLVPIEVVKSEERVGVELYDSDVGQDDFLASAHIELMELLQQPGKAIKRKEQAQGARPGTKRGGVIEWSAVFLPKAPFDESLIKDREGTQPDARGKQDSKERKKPDGGKDAKKEKQPLPVERIPPSPSLPSGILSVQIHEIAALSDKSSLINRGKNHKLSDRTPKTGRVIPDEDIVGDQPAGTDSAPSSYVEVIVEDKIVYRTRTKISDFRPIFNATTEKVILDWRTARVMLVVRQKKYDEDDPILGIVFVKLSEIFTDKSIVSSWYPIAGGTGSGRIKVTLLFRNVVSQQTSEDVTDGGSNVEQETVKHLSTDKARPVSPVEVGTFELQDLSFIANESQQARKVVQSWESFSLQVKSLSSNARLAAKHGVATDSSSQGASPGQTLSYAERLQRKSLRLPLFRRGASPLLLRLETKDSLRRVKIQAMAVLWLRDLPDGKEAQIELPLWGSEDKEGWSWLRQQYVDNSNFHADKDGQDGTADEYAMKRLLLASPKDLGLKIYLLGTARIKVKFTTGVTCMHGRINDPSGRLQVVCQAWKTAVEKGLADEALGGGQPKRSNPRPGEENQGREGDNERSNDSDESGSDSESDSDGSDDDGSTRPNGRTDASDFDTSSGSKLDLLKRASRHLTTPGLATTHNIDETDLPPSLHRALLRVPGIKQDSGSYGADAGNMPDDDKDKDKNDDKNKDKRGAKAAAAAITGAFEASTDASGQAFSSADSSQPKNLAGIVNTDGQGDGPKVLRVLDSAFGNVRFQGGRLKNRFDVRKEVKEGGEVETEV